MFCCTVLVFFFQAEDGIRDLVRSRGLGDVYKRQALHAAPVLAGLLLPDRPRQAAPAVVLLRAADHLLDVGGLRRPGHGLSLIHI